MTANKVMTFDKYIDNPSGGAVFTNRNMYKSMYKTKFDALMVRESGRINYELFTQNDSKDSHYIHFKIPSEVVPEFYYDVVIHLFTSDNKNKDNAKMREYSVEFYSNDPAFVYTFAHSFAKNKLFIKDLESKMSKQALSQKATVRNPKDDVWYVKSLYFAYLAMEKYNLFSKSVYSGCKKYDKKYLCNKIMQAETKVQQRQDEAEKIRKEEALKKSKEKKKINTNANISTNKSRSTNIIKTSNVSKVSSATRSTKKSHIIGTKKHK